MHSIIRQMQKKHWHAVVGIRKAIGSFPNLEIIAQHNHYADRSRKHTYPLTGFMRCGYCGSMLSGQVKKGHLYYNCSHRRDAKCPEKKYTRSELIEEQVVAYLSRVELPPKFKKVLDAYFQHFAKERLNQEENERKSIKHDLVRVQQQIRNIVVDRSQRIIDAEVFIKIQDELLKEKEMYQERLSELETKSDKFVQKFNEVLDFTEHADQVYQKGSTSQKRIVLKLCIDGFTVTNQKLTPIWTPVFDVLMDLQLSKFDPPKVGGKGSKSASKTLAVPQVLTWTSGGGSEIRTHGPRKRSPVFKTGAFNHSAIPPCVQGASRAAPSFSCMVKHRHYSKNDPKDKPAGRRGPRSGPRRCAFLRPVVQCWHMKYLGIDYGTKRIGIALSDESGSLAFPKAVISTGASRSGLAKARGEIADLVLREDVGCIVIGHSLDGDGARNPIMRDIDAFAEELRRLTGVPVELHDERFTSTAARAATWSKPVATPRRGGATVPERIDDRAAAIMLQRYLDTR